jgi:hypothetical protein
MSPIKAVGTPAADMQDAATYGGRSAGAIRTAVITSTAICPRELLCNSQSIAGALGNERAPCVVDEN